MLNNGTLPFNNTDTIEITDSDSDSGCTRASTTVQTALTTSGGGLDNENQDNEITIGGDENGSNSLDLISQQVSKR